MEINENDIRLFYILLSHYNKLSPNIAVVGSIEKVSKQFSEIIYKCKKNHIPIIYNKEKMCIRILSNDGLESNYIRVRDVDDLKGISFRKFI